MSKINSITIVYSCRQEGGQEQSLTIAVDFNAERCAAAVEDSPDVPVAEMTAAMEEVVKAPAFPEEETPPPPPIEEEAGKRKRYTVEEKTEIAMMYASGEPVPTIAEKFGRDPDGIRLLVNRMGVKRGDNPLELEQADASKSWSALKKPWYLKK